MHSVTRNNKRRHHTAPANLSRTAMNHRGLRFNNEHGTKVKAAAKMINNTKTKAAANKAKAAANATHSHRNKTHRRRR